MQQTAALSNLSGITVYHWYDQFQDHPPEEYHVLETIIQFNEAYFTNWCLLMGKRVGSRRLAYDILYRQTGDSHLCRPDGI